MIARPALLVVILLAGCATVRRPHDMAFRIDVTGGSCSATAVGPHTLLTASHCFADGGELTQVNGTPAKATAYVNDGFDHTLVTVDRTFAVYAPIGPAPVQAQHVSYYGNPGPFTDLYRDGCVYGTAKMNGKPVVLYGLNGFPGDSGSGVFDDQGRLVAVISFVWVADVGPRWQAMGSFPLHFTPAQWAKASA